MDLGKLLDPNCAICNQPAQFRCDCEIKGLEIAVRQAEQRIMTPLQDEIREWVRGQAQDYILTYFNTLAKRRHEAHTAHIRTLHAHYSHFYAQPHPAEIKQAEQLLKQAIDADWAASVQRYPEVLEYFYSLVEIRLPGDRDVRLVDPPLSALTGAVRGVKRITRGGHHDGEREREIRDVERDERARDRGRRRATFASPPYPSY